MKIHKPEFARTYVYNLLFIIIVIFVILDSLWVYQAYDDLEQKVKELRSSYLEKQRGLIRNEVMRISSYIDYRKNKITREEKNKLSSRVTNLYANADKLFKENETLPLTEIKEKVLRLIYSQPYNNSKYYALVYSMDKGFIKLGANADSAKKDRQFNLSAETIKELIENNNKVNQLSRDYLWHIQAGGAYGSVNSNRLQYIKLGAIRYFKPLNIFIVLGAYTDGLTDKIQEDILEWIDTVKFPNNQYFFIDKYDGTPLIYDGEKVRNNAQSNASEKTIKTYKKETSRIIDTSGRGYIYYPMSTKGAQGLYHKISYIKTLDDWGWIVGAGVYMEDVENEINIMRAKLEIKTIYNVAAIILILFGFIIISLLIANFIIKKAQKSFNSFYEFFEKTALNSAIIDPKSQTYREFEMLAHSANSMSKKRLQIEAALKYSENRFKDIAESMADWIWEIGDDLNYKYVSGKLEKILGHKGEDFLGTSIPENCNYV
jgi:two-component system, cell cycle sensor histidine kinase and response regulator CckA